MRGAFLNAVTLAALRERGKVWAPTNTRPVTPAALPPWRRDLRFMHPSET